MECVPIYGQPLAKGDELNMARMNDMYEIVTGNNEAPSF